MLVTVPIQTTMIRASMTAYSTAVGPSSDARNLLIRFIIVFLSKMTDGRKRASIIESGTTSVPKAVPDERKQSR